MDQQTPTPTHGQQHGSQEDQGPDLTHPLHAVSMLPTASQHPSLLHVHQIHQHQQQQVEHERMLDQQQQQCSQPPPAAAAAAAAVAAAAAAVAAASHVHPPDPGVVAQATHQAQQAVQQAQAAQLAQANHVRNTPHTLHSAIVQAQQHAAEVVQAAQSAHVVEMVQAQAQAQAQAHAQGHLLQGFQSNPMSEPIPNTRQYLLPLSSSTSTSSTTNTTNTTTNITTSSSVIGPPLPPRPTSSSSRALHDIQFTQQQQQSGVDQMQFQQHTYPHHHIINGSATVVEPMHQILPNIQPQHLLQQQQQHLMQQQGSNNAFFQQNTSPELRSTIYPSPGPPAHAIVGGDSTFMSSGSEQHSIYTGNNSVGSYSSTNAEVTGQQQQQQLIDHHMQQQQHQQQQHQQQQQQQQLQHNAFQQRQQRQQQFYQQQAMYQQQQQQQYQQMVYQNPILFQAYIPMLLNYVGMFNQTPTNMNFAARITQVPYQNSYYQPVVYHMPWGGLQHPQMVQVGASLPQGTTGPTSAGTDAGIAQNREYFESMLKVAHEKYNSQDFSSALTILSNLHQMNPQHSPTLLLLGCTCYSLHMYQLSIQYNNLILQIDPQFAEAYSNLGTTYRAMAMSGNGLNSQDQEERSKALANMALSEKCYRMAISIRPKYWDASMNLSGLLSGMNRNEEALRVYEEFEMVNEAEVPAEARFDTVDSKLSDLEFVGELKRREYLRSEPRDNQSNNANNNGVPFAVGSPTSQVAKAAHAAATLEDPSTMIGLPRKKSTRKNKRNAGGYSDDRRSALYYAKGSLKYNLGDIPGAKQEYLRGLICVGVDVESAFSPERQGQLPPPMITPSLAMFSLQHQRSPTSQTTSSILQTLAKIYQDSNQVFLAVNFYYYALSVYANANTCNNLGIILAHTRLDEAIAWYEFGLGLEHNHVHLLTNLGSALKDRGQVNEGIQCYQRAISLNPEFFIALANLANVFKDLGRVEEAGALYQRALQVKPDFVEAFCNYVNSLFFICNWNDRSSNLSQIKDIVDNQLSDFHLIDFRNITDLSDVMAVSRELVLRTVPTVLPFHTFTYAGLQAHHVREISRRNADRITYNVLSSDWFPGYPQTVNSLHWPYPYPMPEWDGNPDSIINIGYLSSDFNNHPLAHLMQSVFGFHDRSRFKVFCYSLSPSDMSPYRAKIEQEADVFLDVNQWSIEQIVQRVREDTIHVLCNLNGYTKGGRNEVFGARPSPIQLQFMGFAGTLGAGDVFDPDLGLLSDVPTVRYPGMSESAQDMLSDFEGINHRWLDYLVTDEVASPRHLVVGEPVSDELVVDSSNENSQGTSIESKQSSESEIVGKQSSKSILLDRGPIRTRDDSSRIYTESLCYMPYSYFVNDHRQGFRENDDAELDRLVTEENVASVYDYSLKLDKTRLLPIVPEPKSLLQKVRSVSAFNVSNANSYGDARNNRRDSETSSKVVRSSVYYTDEFDDEKTLTAHQRYSWRREQMRRLRMRSEVFPWILEDTVIFANFNQLYKLDPLIFDCWLNILARVPNSILWLLRFPPAGENHLRQHAVRKAGVAIANRIVFTDVAPKHIHIHRGRVADIFLDTPECNAHTTAADILWSGTPVVTYPKYDFKMCSRVCASIAYATGEWSLADRKDLVDKLSSSKYGLPFKRDSPDSQWNMGNWMVVNSYKEYEELAVKLASGIEWVWKPILPKSTNVQVDLHDMDPSLATVLMERRSLSIGPIDGAPTSATYSHASEDDDDDEENDDGDNAPPVPFFTPFHPSRQAPTFILVQRCDSICARLRRALFLTRDAMPLFDTPKWVASLESAVITALTRWRTGFALRKELNARILSGEDVFSTGDQQLSLSQLVSSISQGNNALRNDPVTAALTCSDSDRLITVMKYRRGVEILSAKGPGGGRATLVKMPKSVYEQALIEEKGKHHFGASLSSAGLSNSLDTLTLSPSQTVEGTKGRKRQLREQSTLSGAEGEYGGEEDLDSTTTGIDVRKRSTTVGSGVIQRVVGLNNDLALAPEPVSRSMAAAQAHNSAVDKVVLDAILDAVAVLNSVREGEVPRNAATSTDSRDTQIAVVRRRVSSRCVWVPRDAAT